MAIKQFEKDYFSFLIEMGFECNEDCDVEEDSLKYTRDFFGFRQRILISRYKRAKFTSVIIDLNGPEFFHKRWEDKYKNKEDLLNNYEKYKEFIIERITEFEKIDPSNRITANLNIEILNNYEELYKMTNCDYRDIDEINKYVKKLKETPNISFIDFIKLASSLFIKYLVDVQDQKIIITSLKELRAFNSNMRTSNSPTRELKDFWLSKIDKLELKYRNNTKPEELDEKTLKQVKAYLKKMGVDVDSLEK